MARTRGQKDKYRFHYTVDGVPIPVELSRERRRNVRISCGVDKLYLRLPLYCSKAEAEKFLEWGKDWTEKTWRKHTWFRERFKPKVYHHGQDINTTYDCFNLQLVPSARKNYSGKIDEAEMTIRYPGLFLTEDGQKDIHNLIHKLLGKYYFDFIEEKLERLNGDHFNMEVRALRLTYQNTRWGSCSSDARISLSTKLLFAPEPVLDYVIIHELAHLIEHNHSRRFWSHVERAMPDYRTQEKWLKSHGHECD